MIVLRQVVLRKFEPGDVDRLYRIRNDWEVTQSLTGFPTGFSRREMKEWIHTISHAKDRVIWAIAARKSNLCLGHAGLYQIDQRVGKAEFGILIGDRKWQGRGIGRAVTEAVVAYGFRQLHLHKVWLLVLESNRRASHLYESLGFATDGILRDDQFRNGAYVNTRVMSLLASEWRARHPQNRG